MNLIKKVLWSIVAGFTSPTAIKAEKALAVVVLTRLALTVPAAGFFITQLINWLS